MIVQGRQVVRGVDVSDWQGTVDHQAVKDSGVRFLVAKATEGVRFAAKTYRQNRDGAIKAGLTFAAYHWLKPNLDAVAQARWFLTTTNNGSGCTFLVLDAEEAGITDAQVTAWCREVSTTGKPVVIYCGAYTDPKNRSAEWAKYTPWLAAYPSSAENPDPARLRAAQNPAPWGRWDIWQYSSSGIVPGISGRCDVNVADAAWFDSLTSTTTSKEDDDMPAAIIVNDPDGSGWWECFLGCPERRLINTPFGADAELNPLKWMTVASGGQVLDENADVDQRRFWMYARNPVVTGSVDAKTIADQVIAAIGHADGVDVNAVAKAVADELAQRLTS